MIRQETEGKLFDYSLVTKAFILLFVLILPFQLIHEAGHALPCMAEGFKFSYNISLFGSSLQCLGDVENKTVFRVSGGLLAAIVAVTPYLLFRSNFEKWPFIPVVLLSMAIAQGANAVIETVFYSDYITNGTVSIFSIHIIQAVSFIFLSYRYSKTKPKDYLLDKTFSHFEKSKEDKEEKVRQKWLGILKPDYREPWLAINDIEEPEAKNEKQESKPPIDDEIKELEKKIKLEKLQKQYRNLTKQPSFSEKIVNVVDEARTVRDTITEDRPRKQKKRSKPPTYGFSPEEVFNLDPRPKQEKRRSKGKQKKSKSSRKTESNDYGFNLDNVLGDGYNW